MFQRRQWANGGMRPMSSSMQLGGMSISSFPMSLGQQFLRNEWKFVPNFPIVDFK